MEKAELIYEYQRNGEACGSLLCYNIQGFNDSGYVKEDTRKKVMEIIREYNYTPNMIARSLSSKDSFNIGIIIPNVGENSMERY